jgi:lipopolysaccharide/colanic/teichoic acid biosynthesis glycosyltransferase
MQRFPRILDILASAAGLVILSPLFAVIAIAVRVSSPGPVLYRATRMGRNGIMFRIYKFRSMRRDAAATGSGITSAGDARITPVGRLLRAAKLDELPQLFNVLAGDMCLVGPRPEDPRFVPHYPIELRGVLGLKPGITSAASVYFRDESSLLTGDDHERDYIEHILPAKLKMDLEFFREASVWDNLLLIARTVFGILKR